MKTFLTALFAASAFTSLAAETNMMTVSPSIAKDSRCFELRTYHVAPGKLEALNARFRDHTCALFRKHGIEIVGFWMPTAREQGADNKLVYLLVHQKRDSAQESWAAFRDDPDWKKAQTESEVNGKLIEKIESVFMGAADYSPLK